MTHGETKAQKGEVTSLDHTDQATEARGRLCRPGQMVEAGRGGLGPLRAWGSPLPNPTACEPGRSEAGPDRWDFAGEECSESEGPLSS